MDQGDEGTVKEHFEGPDAPASFVVPDEQVESLKQRSTKGGLAKIGVPGSIRTYRKRVESTSQWASKAARKTAALPQKNISNAKKSIAKRLKPEEAGTNNGAQHSSPSIQGRKKHLKHSGGSMPSGQVRSVLSLSTDADSPRKAQHTSPLAMESGSDERENREKAPAKKGPVPEMALPLGGAMGSRTGSFDDLVMQESKQHTLALSPVQSHTYLLDSEDGEASISPHKRSFLRASSDGRPKMFKMPSATRNESAPPSNSRTGDENSDFDEAEEDFSMERDFSAEDEAETFFVADDDEEEAGSPEYDPEYLAADDEALHLYSAVAAGVPDRERKNLNRLILSIPKGATKKSRRAGNYLLNVPKGVKSSVATGMDRASGVAGIPGKKVSKMVKGYNESSPSGSPDARSTLVPAPVSSEELQQFLKAGTQDGKFVKAVPPAPEVVGSHKKKSLVRSVRGVKSTDSGMDKKQLRKEISGIKQNMEQLTRVSMNTLEATRSNSERLLQYSSSFEVRDSTLDRLRNEGQQERLALHRELCEVSKKLDSVVKAVQAQQQHIALVEGRLMTMQRHQATQFTLLGLLFIAINWIVVGLSFVQLKVTGSYQRMAGKLPPSTSVPAIENCPMVEDVTTSEDIDEVQSSPRGHLRSNALKMEDPVKFGRFTEESEGEATGSAGLIPPVSDEEDESEEDEVEPLLRSSGSLQPSQWDEDAPPPSVASVAAAHAAGIQAEHERLLRQRAEGRSAPGSAKRLRPSFANSKYTNPKYA